MLMSSQVERHWDISACRFGDDGTCIMRVKSGSQGRGRQGTGLGKRLEAWNKGEYQRHYIWQPRMGPASGADVISVAEGNRPQTLPVF